MSDAPAERLILVIEDEAQVARFLRASLTSHGFRLIEATTGAQGLAEAAARVPDLVLLDLGLPDLDGVEVARRLREWTAVPILVLSARGQERDKIEALDAGADDYLTKPFDFPELAARVRALLRRPEDARTPVLTAGDIRLDPAAHTVWRGAVVVPLTAREFALLHYLLDRKGLVVRRGDLLEAVWDTNYDGVSNVVDVHVANLRRKLDLPGNPAPIETVRGVGYRIDP